MEVQEIKDKTIWENFLSSVREKTFLNSWNWGEFNKKMGHKVWRYGIFEGQTLISISQIIKVPAKRSTFLFLPHGPNFIKEFQVEAFKILLEKLKNLAKSEKCHFIRIAPILERTKENEKIFQDLDFRKAPIHIHPEAVWEMAIDIPEEEILKKMRKTTRYLIRKALHNKELEVIEDNTLEGVRKFNQIYLITKERQKFVPFSLDYLQNEFLVFQKDNQISVLLVKYKKEIVSGGIFIFWQKIAFYHHGASSQKYPKIPASYLLIWKAIQKAKEKGCEKFNFWGIAERDWRYKIFNFAIGKHPWWGLTLFKKGFPGQEKQYLKTQDFVLSKKYWFNFMVETLRKIKRGL